MDDSTTLQTCGFCRGTGQVPGRKHDAYGYREDYPDLVTCDYCDGSGECEDGENLLPARLAATPDAYDKKTVERYG